MTTLIDRIRAGRRFTVKVAGMTFTGSRPTVEQFTELYKGNASECEMVRAYVDGWSNVKEKDIIKGGSNKLVDFDKDLFDVVIGDMPVIWHTIAVHLANEVKTAAVEIGENQKNLAAGATTSN